MAPNQLQVEIAISFDGLIHMLIANKTTCVVFSIDDFTPRGLNHTLLLYILVVCFRHRVPFVLLDNGFILNVCPLATAIALGFKPSDFESFTQIVRTYDSIRKEVLGILMLNL